MSLHLVIYVLSMKCPDSQGPQGAMRLSTLRHFPSLGMIWQYAACPVSLDVLVVRPSLFGFNGDSQPLVGRERLHLACLTWPLLHRETPQGVDMSVALQYVAVITLGCNKHPTFTLAQAASDVQAMMMHRETPQGVDRIGLQQRFHHPDFTTE